MEREGEFQEKPFVSVLFFSLLLNFQSILVLSAKHSGASPF